MQKKKVNHRGQAHAAANMMQSCMKYDASAGRCGMGVKVRDYEGVPPRRKGAKQNIIQTGLQDLMVTDNKKNSIRR